MCIIAEMYLSDCEFDGPLPEGIGNLANMVILDMSNNLFTGEVPSSYANLPNLESFDVSGNNVTGAIPAGMCNIEELTTLVADCEVECGCCSECVE